MAALEQSASSNSTLSCTFGSTPAAGNLIAMGGHARNGASGPAPTVTRPDASWSNPVFTIAPMEAHTAALCAKESDGTESGALTMTASAASVEGCDLVEFSGITTPTLDKSIDDGSGATSVTSITPDTVGTGTLGASAGVAIAYGLSRTGIASNVLSWDSGFSEINEMNPSQAGSSYHVSLAWLNLTSNASLNPRVTSSNGSSRMGAGLAVFIPAGSPPSPASLVRPRRRQLFQRGLITR
jgi:hypothetical protein